MAAQHRERRRRRAEHRHPRHMRRGASERLGGKIGGFGVRAADDQRGQPPERRQMRVAQPLRRLGFQEAVVRSLAASARMTG